MSYQYYDFNTRRKRARRTWLILAAIVGLLLLCCAYAGKVDPQHFVLAPFMVLAFMPMMILTLILVLVALFKRRWLAAFIMALSVALTMPVLMLYVGMVKSANRSPVPADTTLILKVMTYNVLSFNFQEPDLSAQPSASMRLILDANPDVVLLQEGSARGLNWDEIPSVAPFVDEIKAKYPYCYQSGEGLNLMSKYPFTTVPLGEPEVGHSPLGYNRDLSSYIARAYDLQLPRGKQLRLIDFRLQSYHLSFGKNPNVRVSPDVKPAPLERMRRSFGLRGDNAKVLRQAIDQSPANVIMCGDMNDVSASHVYRVIRGDDLKDAWADAGSGYARTFNRYHLPFHIDHIFYRGDVRALDVKRLKGGSSDHYPLLAAFDIDITQ